jgi:hypothetical protein
MWAEALELLDQAERVNRAMFRPGPGRPGGARRPALLGAAVDLLETDGELWIRCASRASARAPGGPRRGRGAGRRRRAPAAAPPGGAGVIRRLEIPHGRFERRIGLPPGSYELRRRDLRLGCLTITLRKLA